jgi:hypothetical protein
MLKNQTRTAFALFHFYDHWVVAEVHEGINVNRDMVNQTIALMHQVFEDRPYLYLSHRLHDHSVCPVEMARLIHQPNLVAAGFIFRSLLSALVFQQERPFYRKPTHVFEEISGALDWAHRMMPQLVRAGRRSGES